MTVAGRIPPLCGAPDKIGSALIVLDYAADNHGTNADIRVVNYSGALVDA